VAILAELAQNLKNDYFFSKIKSTDKKSNGAYSPIPIQYDKPQIKAELEL
jgi:hypothetical protein